MKEQFVTYEIALKLKKLGFDEFCFAHYINGDLITKTAILKSSTMQYYQQNNINPSNQYKDKKCTAPLWQQVIDWFRNKYNLLIDSPKLDELNIGKWSVKITSLDKSTVLEEFVDQPYWRLYRCFRTYEEAREQAILKAIELIKNKN